MIERERLLEQSVRDLLQIAELAQYYAPGELGEGYGLMEQMIQQARKVLAEPTADAIRQEAEALSDGSEHIGGSECQCVRCYEVDLRLDRQDKEWEAMATPAGYETGH